MMFGPIAWHSYCIYTPLVVLFSVVQCNNNNNNAFVSSLQIPCSSLGKKLLWPSSRTSSFGVRRHDLVLTKEKTWEDVDVQMTTTFLHMEDDESSLLQLRLPSNLPKAATASSAALLILFPFSAVAVSTLSDRARAISEQLYNPENFKPVCATSDSFYRLLQGTTQALVGADNFVEYGPLISGGLLRVRLELCVVESYFSEAIIPFIKANGIGWILPLHETVETFLAGFIFAVATTFILVGSTKLLAVLVFYGDAIVGLPCRLLGGFAFDRALGKPVTVDIGFGPWKKQLFSSASSKDTMDDDDTQQLNGENNIQIQQYPALLLSGAVKGVGEVSRVTREIVEGADFFVGRYLTILASGYIALKFLHFKVFPDFPFL